MRRQVNGLMIMCLIAAFSQTPAIAGADEPTVLQAPDGTVVEIKRDEYGVPHILAETQAAVFFGQGFATAQDRLVQLEQFRRIAEGRLARLAGEAFVEADMWTKTLFYTESERREQFAQLSAEGKEMLEAYRDGINTYLDSMAVNPQKYQPFEVLLLPFLGLTLEPWTVTNSIAIVQFVLRRFGTYGGHELDRLVELQENGQAWFDEHRPINEAGAPTTIPDDDTGASSPSTWRFSGSTVRPEIVRTLAAERQRVSQRIKEAGLPPRLGSFAVLLSAQKSSSGNAMLLGGPQLGAPAQDSVSIINEVELACPTLHIGGATFAGIPGVIIGRNASIAWTFTSGRSDNTDTYIDSTQGSSFGKYRHNDAWLDFTVIQDTVLTGASAIPFVHYRTIHGPVFGHDLDNHQVFSQRYTVWNREVDLLPGLLRMWKATTLAEFEAGVAFIPFSLNLFYAGRDQNVKFWHLGRYQDRTDGIDPRLPHKGDGSEEWRGFIPFESLPAAANPQQGYFVNWNQKPVSWWNNGDNIAWAFDNDLSALGVDRVLQIDSYVQAIPKLSFDDLKGVRTHLADYASYEQVLELAPDRIWGENLIPPGQSGFISRTAVRSPHFSDQWSLFTNFELKEMIFGDDVPTSVEEDLPVKPTSFVLYQNYPNPFNPSTTITYDVAARGHVSLKIYNLLGREIASLVDVVQEKGRKRVVFDATRFASGVYVYRLSVNSSVQTRKLILLR